MESDMFVMEAGEVLGAVRVGALETGSWKSMSMTMSLPPKVNLPVLKGNSVDVSLP